MVIAFLAAVAAQSTLAAPPAPPLPVVSVPAPTQVGPALVQFVPGEVRCGDGIERAVQQSAVQVMGIYGIPARPTEPIRMAFAIDPSGRPVGIGEPQGPGAAYNVIADLAPALASWRFAAGSAREGCSISFAQTIARVADAPVALVHRYHALPHDRGAADAAVWQRLRAGEGDCFKGAPPAVRLRAYPDFDAIPQAPGTLSYAMIGHDIDASGKPTNVRLLDSDGNAALDAAALKAVRESRFAPQARTGCFYPYHRRQAEPLAAPPTPEAAAFRKGETCPGSADWQVPPRMTFPRPFQRRNIEGWAIIGYDAAPWGATGNVEVLAAEPAAAFGTAAANIVRQAKRKPSETGARGCVTRVVFKLPKPGEPEPPEPIEPPPPF